MRSTFRGYLDAIDALQAERPEYRPGQTAFTVLHRMRPDLSVLVRMTVVDPFYRQAPSLEFYEWVRENW